MRDLARNTHFAVKALQKLRMAGSGLRQKLQCDGLVEFEVVSAIHLAHAAFAGHAKHSIPFGQDCTGDKTIFIGRARRRWRLVSQWWDRGCVGARFLEPQLQQTPWTLAAK